MAGRRRALLLGCGRVVDRSLAPLRAPSRDVRELSRVLEGLDGVGYQTDTAVDCTSRDAQRAIDLFFSGAQVTDSVNLLYFSCHGVQDANGKLYFAFSDTEMRLLSSTAVSADWVRDRIYESRSRATLVLIDCCFSGAFLKGMAARSHSEYNVGALIRDLPDGTGVAVLTASGETERSFEDTDAPDARPSYFTDALIVGLETGAADMDQDGKITVEELYDFVYGRVLAGPSPQRPRWLRNGEGRLVVAGAPRTGNTTPAPARQIPQPTESWQVQRQVRAPASSTAPPPRRLVRDYRLRLGLLRPTFNLRAVAFNSNGESVAVGGAPAYAQLISVATGRPAAPPFSGHRNMVVTLAFSPDGTLLATGDADGTAIVFDTTTEHLVATLPHPAVVRAMAFDPTSILLATCSNDGFVRFWEARTGAPYGDELRFHDGYSYSVAFSPDGGTLAVGGNEYVCLINTSTWQLTADLPCEGTAYSIQFSGDGRFLAAGGGGPASKGFAKLWDGGSHEQIGRPMVTEKPVNAVSFRPDGELLATCGGNLGSPDLIRLWEPSTSRAVGNLDGQQAETTSVAFSPDGGLLASVDTQGRLRLWGS
ncbi:caspase family protein [Actinoplanes sp. NPDC049802]|uniref:caspase, EACC1-associated type n=1 Tax=Actinoplanes sp. NPDC049802 TaxID=3154742 RepID=UPI0033F0EC2E